MKLYLETSALLRAALQQQREVTECMRRATAWVTSALTLIECERTLVSMLHARRVSRAQSARAHAYLRDVVWRTDVSELDASVLERAGQPFPVEPVRSLDGLHLASILRWSEQGPLDAVTSDARVNDNATALGITVWYFPLEP